LQFEGEVVVSSLKAKLSDIVGIPAEEQRLSTGSRELRNTQIIGDFAILSLNVRLAGGKGGFGALLRGAGAKAGQKKPSSYDDCRDLNGRRIRHVKSEKKLGEWYSGEKDREEEEQERKQRIREAEMAKREHVFDSSTFVYSLAEINENIEGAVEEGLKRKKEEPVHVEEPPIKRKKNMLWTEFDDLDDASTSHEKDKEGISATHATTSNGEQAAKGSQTIAEKLDLDKYSSAEELEALGLNKLKDELQKLGLLCGGNIQERAKRLFSLKGKKMSEVDPKLFAKKKKGK